MKTVILYFLVYLLRFSLWFRYRVTVKGYENLNSKILNKPGGILFLPNHPASFIDPIMATVNTWPDFPLRPLIIDYMYNLPVVNGIMKFINALPVPDFTTSSNSFKRKRNDEVIEEVAKGLKKGENFLIYPAGSLKQAAHEKIGGASATHRLISEVPEANVVLIRFKGLWGSTFSRAFLGKTPPLFDTLWEGIKTVFKNLIFFTPRRHVTIEFHPAPEDFPYKASRLEMNRWLENWYNQPDGLIEQKEEYPGDSLVLVSYKFWKEDVPELFKEQKGDEQVVQIFDIGNDVQEAVLGKLQELSDINSSKISPEMSLSSDLGLDSLDISDLAAFVQDQFETGPIPMTEFTTVNRVMAIASKKIKIETTTEESKVDLSNWKYTGERYRTQVAHGDTISEVFLHNCERMGDGPACADMRSGVLSYSRLKLAVILFAEHIRHLPGKYIGVMLPASVGAYISVLACQLAGKVPMMINWTTGPRHLRAICDLSKVEVVLSSMAFIERLDSIDLGGMEDKFAFLENIRRDLSIIDKLRGLYRSKLNAKALMKTFGIDKKTKDDEAVLLFTSGTESLPKGVPLTHENVLSNQRSAFEAVEMFSDDVLYGILPPFHAFGFNTTGLMGLLSGMRSAYYPDPTDGEGIAKGFETWGATIMAGAPSFIKAMLKAATPSQLKTMRICVTGAEKAPPELFQLMAEMGKEQCLLEGYGVTEASPMVTGNRPGKPRKGVGGPFPGVKLLAVHPETHQEVQKGTEGLILVRGSNVFSGYLNPGVASPFITVKGKEWYNTGDIGILDEDDRLVISGRLKRFIKIGGEMVSLLAIESDLLSAASQKGWSIKEEGPSLAVIAKEVPGGKPHIILVTTFDTDVEEVNQLIRDAGFSNLVKVSKVVKVDEIEIMGTGKIHYRLLEDLFLKDEVNHPG